MRRRWKPTQWFPAWSTGGQVSCLFLAIRGERLVSHRPRIWPSSQPTRHSGRENTACDWLNSILDPSFITVSTSPSHSGLTEVRENPVNFPPATFVMQHRLLQGSCDWHSLLKWHVMWPHHNTKGCPDWWLPHIKSISSLNQYYSEYLIQHRGTDTWINAIILHETTRIKFNCQYST